MELSGRRALVFGGTSGIGLATTQRLSGLGARVTAVSRNPERARSAVSATTELLACDVRDRAALSDLFVRCAPFDVLVCAATGGARAVGPFLQMDLDGYRNSFDKLWGYAHCVRLGAEHLSADGAIVLVSGTPARRARPGQSAIASVGGAVEQLCRALAVELKPRRINVVSPGIIDTPMYGDDEQRRSALLQGATRNHVIARAGTADEVAQAIVFTLQNDFVTGTTVDVDGGWLLS